MARFEIYSTRTILQRLVGWLFEQRKLHVAKLDLAWDGKQWIQKKLQFHSIGLLFIYRGVGWVKKLFFENWKVVGYKCDTHGTVKQ